jgi:hypothetical protein
MDGGMHEAAATLLVKDAARDERSASLKASKAHTVESSQTALIVNEVSASGPYPVTPWY